MITSIKFHNFRILKKATLPLRSFNVILGPNESGKSTALMALEAIANPKGYSFESLATLGCKKESGDKVILSLRFSPPKESYSWQQTWPEENAPRRIRLSNSTTEESDPSAEFPRIRVFSFDPRMLASSAPIQPNAELGPNGQALVGVLDRMRDSEPERFDALNAELSRWIPDYDRIVFQVPQPGHKSFGLRSPRRKTTIPSTGLSHGTLYCLAFLTLAHLPDPPPVIGIEEPDRGIHPRLFREVRDALYRLSYPQRYGDARSPVQVIITTHSPYFLDLFKEHPEEVILAERKGSEATFHSLVERNDLTDILAGAPLGEVWYSGVLGGVPAKP